MNMNTMKKSLQDNMKTEVEKTVMQYSTDKIVSVTVCFV